MPNTATCVSDFDALSACRESVNVAVEERLGWPQQARSQCRKICDRLSECPDENWDEVGTRLGSRFDEMLKDLADLRNGPVHALQASGYEIASAAQLEDDIRALEEVKRDVLATWPWSSCSLPQTRWNAGGTAMLDVCGTHGEPIQELIQHLGDRRCNA